MAWKDLSQIRWIRDGEAVNGSRADGTPDEAYSPTNRMGSDLWGNTAFLKGAVDSTVDAVNAHFSDLSIHRAMNDNVVTNTNLWSAAKIKAYIDGQAASPSDGIISLSNNNQIFSIQVHDVPAKHKVVAARFILIGAGGGGGGAASNSGGPGQAGAVKDFIINDKPYIQNLLNGTINPSFTLGKGGNGAVSTNTYSVNSGSPGEATTLSLPGKGLFTAEGGAAGSNACFHESGVYGQPGIQGSTGWYSNDVYFKAKYDIMNTIHDYVQNNFEGYREHQLSWTPYWDGYLIPGQETLGGIAEGNSDAHTGDSRKSRNGSLFGGCGSGLYPGGGGYYPLASAYGPGGVGFGAGGGGGGGVGYHPPSNSSGGGAQGIIFVQFIYG